jgi:CRISPR-associated endoribonuclease Cas6
MPRPRKLHEPQDLIALPLPFNVSQSYLRRWNDFSGQAVEADSFLAWVDESVILLRHHVRSHKVAVGRAVR